MNEREKACVLGALWIVGISILSLLVVRATFLFGNRIREELRSAVY
jgi:hypothetical protein